MNTGDRVYMTGTVRHVIPPGGELQVNWDSDVRPFVEVETLRKELKAAQELISRFTAYYDDIPPALLTPKVDKNLAENGLEL
jgi:hypothetical protein